MKTIALGHGLEALVDDEDYERVAPRRWKAYRHAVHSWYATSTPSTRERREQGLPGTIYMHRVILGAGRGQEVDHVDGNGLDNRRENLRFCTRTQNLQNQAGGRGSSRFKGVSWRKRYGTWRAYIKVGARTLHLGTFEDEHLAARAYDAAARQHFGEFARPNFAD